VPPLHTVNDPGTLSSVVVLGGITWMSVVMGHDDSVPVVTSE
jgi:hypothetical protein